MGDKITKQFKESKPEVVVEVEVEDEVVTTLRRYDDISYGGHHMIHRSRYG